MHGGPVNLRRGGSKFGSGVGAAKVAAKRIDYVKVKKNLSLMKTKF